jgi:hypothetical protein
MANYTDKGLMSGSNFRNVTLNATDDNIINATHTFRRSIKLGTLTVNQAEHADPNDHAAGRVTISKDNGEVESDGQVLVISRTGGTDWNSLTMRGPEHTSSVVELVDGTDKHLGQTNSHGTRIGFCGVSAHTGTIAAGGLGVERNETFFLQVGNSTSVTNVLDVSIADGEVYFYQSLRSVGASGFTQVNSGDVLFRNSDSTHNVLSPLSSLLTDGLNNSQVNARFVEVKGYADDLTSSSEDGRLAISVSANGSLQNGLEVRANGANAEVRVSGAYSLPTADGTANYFLQTDGSGNLDWAQVSFTETDTLATVTARGATTNDAITVNGITSNNASYFGNILPTSSDTYSLGAINNRWENLFLSSGAQIWFATDAYLSHDPSEGLSLDMLSESTGEPIFKINSGSSQGPTLNLFRDLATPSSLVGAIKFTTKDNASNVKEFARVDVEPTGYIASSEKAVMTLRVMNSGSLDAGLAVEPNLSIGNPLVKISDAYTLPYADATQSGYVILADGLGGSYWGAIPLQAETDTLDTVTSRGNTTSNIINVGSINADGGIFPAGDNAYALGSSTKAWSDLWLGDGSRIYMNTSGSDRVYLAHNSGVGLDLHILGEQDGEPEFRVIGTSGANSVGPQVSLLFDAATDLTDEIGILNFKARDNFGNDVTYGRIVGRVGSTVNTLHDGEMTIEVAVNGTQTSAITIDNNANVDMIDLDVAHSGGNSIGLKPQSTANALTMNANSSGQYNNLALYGATDSASVIGVSESGQLGAATYKGFRIGYAGSSAWETVLGAPAAEAMFLQVGNETDGLKNVLSVSANSGNTKTVFHGNIDISGVEYNTNPTLSLVNDKGGFDLQISSDDAASTAQIDCSLAGLTINTSSASLAGITLDSGFITLDASQYVEVLDSGTSLYQLPSSSPATNGYLLEANGVGNALTFTNTVNLGSGSSIAATTVGATTGNITYVGSTTLTVQNIDASRQIDLNVNGSGVPAWCEYGNTNSVSGVVTQQKGSNPLTAEDRRSGYWLIARDSNATNAPATPSDVGWVMSAVDSSYTMQHLSFRRTEDALSTNAALIGYLDSQAAAGVIDFTGQHRSVKSESAPEGIESMVGYIVVSDGTYVNLDGQTTTPTINEALPRVTLSDQPNQKSAYGVISDAEDDSDERIYSSGAFKSVFAKNDDRLIINALGEGGIWICNIAGDFENGDLITTCTAPGLGALQADDIMRSCTVAKITQDCAFDLNSTAYECVEFEHEGQTYRRAFVGCTYHCG